MRSGKVLLPVNQLKFGMFVSELDRPWVGTPFIFQGFRVQKIEEIERLRAVCERVYVDIEKSIDYRSASAASKPPPAPTLKRKTYEMSASFEQEVLVANEIRETTRIAVEGMFEDVSRGRNIDLGNLRQIVSQSIDGVLRNPDAHLCITQLKRKDDYTAQHSINVSILSLAFGRHLGLPRDELEILGMGALLHDVGKIRTPTDLLLKPGKLTPQEFEIVKAHSVDGHEILNKSYGLPRRIAETALSHHERFNGGGYPLGLRSNQIPFWSRIVAIVDVYDAITSERVYHNAVPSTEALTKMYEWRLSDFDAELLEQFIQCVGIYPVGTLVQLTGGEVGLVVSVNPQLRLRPKVKVLLDRNKRPYDTPRLVDLSERILTDPETTEAIDTVLMPGAYGIDLRRHLDAAGPPRETSG
jgi:putative nucleotidyltransferase with HDIG domain